MDRTTSKSDLAAVQTPEQFGKLLERLRGDRGLSIREVERKTVRVGSVSPGTRSASTRQRNLHHNVGLLRPLLAETGFELRVVDYLGPYTLYAYDPNTPHGKLDLRLSSFRGKHELRPTFRVAQDRDPDWFEYFFDQFTQIWDAGEEVSPQP